MNFHQHNQPCHSERLGRCILMNFHQHNQSCHSERSEESPGPWIRILRCAQNDNGYNLILTVPSARELGYASLDMAPVPHVR